MLERQQSATDQIMTFAAFEDNSSTNPGRPKTDLVAADITLLVYHRQGLTAITQYNSSGPTGTVTDKSNPNDAHSDGAIYPRGGNVYECDAADTVFAANCAEVTIRGTWSDSGDGTSGYFVGAIYAVVDHNPLTKLALVAEAGDEMDLVDAPNATAVTAIQSGLSTLDAGGVRAAIGLASANLDTQIGDVPTNAELTAALTDLNDPSASAIADAVWSAGSRTLTGFGTLIADIWGSILAAPAIRSALGFASADADDQFDSVLAAISGIEGGAGSGEKTITVHVTNASGGADLAGCSITVKDSADLVKGQATTDANGEGTVYLDNGPYTVIVSRDGFVTKGQAETVAGDGTIEVELTAHGPPASEPGQVTGRYRVYVNGVPTAGETVTITAVGRPTSGTNSTGIVDEHNNPQVSDANGYCYFTGLFPGVTYESSGAGVSVKTPIASDASGTVDLNTIVGDGT